jgi:hypothetical protein
LQITSKVEGSTYYLFGSRWERRGQGWLPAELRARVRPPVFYFALPKALGTLVAQHVGGKLGSVVVSLLILSVLYPKPSLYLTAACNHEI